MPLLSSSIIGFSSGMSSMSIGLDISSCILRSRSLKESQNKDNQRPGLEDDALSTHLSGHKICHDRSYACFTLGAAIVSAESTTCWLADSDIEGDSMSSSADLTFSNGTSISIVETQSELRRLDVERYRTRRNLFGVLVSAIAESKGNADLNVLTKINKDAKERRAPRRTMV